MPAGCQLYATRASFSMARQHARVSVVAAADAGADVEINRFAAVEFGGRLRMRKGRGED
jgi:hypothetical protein